jgi:D-alanyl-D-alanine carboxypeptidase/D-alanyl-D-alanine-endopeptidase (penicillin-binding protein 4)
VLDVLKPDTRFTTSVVASSVTGGVVHGDLALVGGGDPLLSTDAWAARHGPEAQPRTSLEALADAVKAAGVTTVTGAVVGDDSRYDGLRKVPSWPARYQSGFEVGPLSALSVDDGYASVVPQVPAPDPPAAAASTFTTLLRARGVTVAGAPRSGAAPAGAATVAKIESAPVRQQVASMLTESDNGTAELLLKEIARSAGTVPGTTAGGAAVVQALTGSLPVSSVGVVTVDGSGLDTGNRSTCNVLVAELTAAGPTGELSKGLAVAGRTGTLAKRFVGTPLAGKLIGKTGTLAGVSNLAGWVPTADGRWAAFAMLCNAPNCAAVAPAAWEAMGRLLVAYPAAADLAPFGPAPAVAAPAA